MLQTIHDTGCRYVLRAPSGVGVWREFRGLQRRRIADARVTIVVDSESINVRHLRVSGGPGRPRKNSRRETQFLITNLPKQWSKKRIGKLYAARWGVETMFRELKCTLEGGGLRSRTELGVTQELDARAIHLTIAAYLDIAAVNEALRGHERAKISVNRSALLVIIMIVLILPDDDPARGRRAAQAAVTTARRAQAKRDGRFAPRKKPMFAK